MKAMRAGAEAEAEAQAQAQAEAQAQAQAPPPPKRCRITNFQADAGSSSSGHPQLHAPSFDLDPPADLGLLQLPDIRENLPR